MLSKSHPIILFIDRFGFSIYQDTVTNIPKFNFTPDLVSNLDVISKEQFKSLILKFIQINKITPSSLAVILSDNIIYVRDLAVPQKPAPAQDLKVDSNNDKEHEDEVQNFLENIPFEEVFAKVIKIRNMNRIVAVNKDLVMTIIDVFAGNKSVIEAITPSFVFGQNVSFTTGLTSSNVKVILEDIETLKLGNLMTDQEKAIPSQNLEDQLKNLPANETKKPRNLRQYILTGVFVVLLIALGVVYLTLGRSQTPSSNSGTENISAEVVSVPTVTPALTQVPIATLSADLKSIKIKITQSSQTDERVTNLKNELLDMGFEDVVNEVSKVTTAEKSSVIFSQDIPADLRNTIIVEIKKILPDISILESQDSISTINISIGKS